ncbi:MAG: integrase core domain-containing protein [Sulfurimonas sp.]|nr:integrase core domain-containing protein [Sulfurimonas sp.]
MNLQKIFDAIKMADWLIEYNTEIPHHSLQMKTPIQYLIETNPQCQMLWTNTNP